MVIPGHSNKSKLVAIKSPYATTYYFSIVTNNDCLLLFEALARGITLEARL